MTADPIATRIRQRRLALGLSFRKLAAVAGLASPAFVLQIENGTKVPSEDVAGRIARALDEDEQIFRAWSRCRGRGDLMTILDAAAILTRAGDFLPDGPQGSAAVAGTAMAAESTLAMTARLAWSAVARPGSTPEPTRLKVPILESGADPGDGLHPGCPVIGYLRIDISTLPDPTTWIRPIAYRVSAADHRRVPELPEGDLALVTRAARPPRPFEAFAIRATRGVGLCRVLWNGRALLRLPEHGSSDFEVVDAPDVHALRARLVGPVVRVLPQREAPEVRA